MGSNPFDNAVLANAVQQLPNLPNNQVNAGVTLNDDGQPIAEVQGEKDLGKGWFAEGDAQYNPQATKSKWSLAAWIGWKK